MSTDHLTRQLEIIPLNKLGIPITIIGAGAIGSFTTLCLAKMGFENLTVYDFDKVSVENMNCQWYRFADIGKPKVEALRALIHDFTGNMISIQNKFSADNSGQVKELRGIVISAVDSMAVRREIWSVVAQNFRVQYFIDPRMAAEYAITFVMNPNDARDIKAYETTLYGDDMAVHENCTAKATMYTATMIAGYVAKHVKDLVTEKPYARVTHWNIADNVLQNWKKDDTKID